MEISKENLISVILNKYQFLIQFNNCICFKSVN